ncbi:MAG: DUF2807 domain-containing protein [Halobacteriota archaeon]
MNQYRELNSIWAYALAFRCGRPFHGVLQGSDAQSVQVEAASNIISSIRMEVKNDILMIDAAQPIVTTKPITIHIGMGTVQKTEKHNLHRSTRSGVRHTE